MSIKTIDFNRAVVEVTINGQKFTYKETSGKQMQEYAKTEGFSNQINKTLEILKTNLTSIAPNGQEVLKAVVENGKVIEGGGVKKLLEEMMENTNPFEFKNQLDQMVAEQKAETAKK